MDTQQVSTQKSRVTSLHLVNSADEVISAFEAVDALADAITRCCASYERNHPGISMGPSRALNWALGELELRLKRHYEAATTLHEQEVRP